MVVRKPSRGASTTRPCNVSLGEKAMEWTTKSSPPQSLAISLENRLHLAGCAHVERHQDRRFEFARQRFDVFLGFVVEIGDRELRAQRAKRLGAAPGDGLVIGNADDEASLAFEQLRFHGGNHS